MYAPSQAAAVTAPLKVKVYVAVSEPVAIRRYDHSDWELTATLEFSVHPEGVAPIPNDVPSQPMITISRSFACTPAGVSTTRLVPPTTVFVVADRRVMGVVFLSVTVTV